MIPLCLILPVLLVTGCSAQPKPQVKVTDEVVGNGQTAHNGDVVSIDYTGKLVDGTVFDTSIGKKQFMFMIGIGQVIPGLDAGVDGMKEGGRRVITIPPELAYGNLPVQGIPAKSTLVFTINLAKMMPKVEIDVLAKGSGPGVRFGDRVALIFSGGPKGGVKVFDSAALYGNDPVTVIVGEQAVPFGWVPALAGMQEGEKRRVEIPPMLAYGDKGIPQADTTDKSGKLIPAGSLVPPNTTMEFTFQLVKLNPDLPAKKPKTGS
jgi:FKBP-type peptidyl-prolyl cis-trans isomerase